MTKKKFLLPLSPRGGGVRPLLWTIKKRTFFAASLSFPKAIQKDNQDHPEGFSISIYQGVILILEGEGILI